MWSAKTSKNKLGEISVVLDNVTLKGDRVKSFPSCGGTAGACRILIMSNRVEAVGVLIVIFMFMCRNYRALSCTRLRRRAINSGVRCIELSEVADLTATASILFLPPRICSARSTRSLCPSDIEGSQGQTEYAYL